MSARLTFLYQRIPSVTWTNNNWPWGCSRLWLNLKPRVKEHPKWKRPNILYWNAVGGFDLFVIELNAGFLSGAIVGGVWRLCCALSVRSEATCPVWRQRMDGLGCTYKGPGEMCRWGGGGGRGPIHFQHHFTQDDLITLCEWTVPAMRATRGPQSLHLQGAWRMMHYTLLHSRLCVDCVACWGAQMYSRCPFAWFYAAAWLKGESNSFPPSPWYKHMKDIKCPILSALFKSLFLCWWYC